MFYRILFFLIGFGLMVIGSMYIIIYMNLLSIGYNFLEYVKFISRRLECYYLIIGFILIILSTRSGAKKDGLFL